MQQQEAQLQQQQAAYDAGAQAQQAAYAQQQQAAAAQAAAPVASPGAMTDNTIAQLQQLAELQKAGVLTPEEFAQQKAKILGA